MNCHQDKNMSVSDPKSEQIHTMQCHPYILIVALSILMLDLLFIPQAWAGESRRDIVMMVDNSGSMKKNDPEFLAHRALETFVSSSEDYTRVALISFDKNVNLSVPFTPLTDTSRSLLFYAINEIDYSGPLTNSPQALERAIYEFALNGRDDAEKSIVFITDGIVDTGSKARDKLQEARMQNELSTLASKLNIRIFGIAFADAANYPLIEELVSKTKGEYFRVLTAEELPGVFARVEAISRPAATALPEETPPAKSALEMPPDIETANETQDPDDTAGPAWTVEKKPVDEQSDAEHVLNRDEKPAQSQPLSISGMLLNTVRRLYSGNELVIYCIALLALIALSALLLSRKSTPSGTTSHPVSNSSFEDDQLRALLIDTDNHTSIRNHPLTTKITRIGRAKTRTYNDDIHHLWLDKPSIGREHAFIEYKDGGYWLTDNDSANGTFVNSKRVKGRTRLKDGHRISFHDAQFLFSIPDLSKFEETVSVPAFNPRERSEHDQDTRLTGTLDTRRSLRTASLAGRNVNRSQTDIGSYKRSQDNTRLESAKYEERNSKSVSGTDLQNHYVSNEEKGTSIRSSSVRQAEQASKTVSAVKPSSPKKSDTEELEAVKLAHDENTQAHEQNSRQSDTAEIQVAPAPESKKKTAVSTKSDQKDALELDIVKNA